ncbi:hypothetical protein HYC85_023195 [Camellia sinensis]|uniref:Uncharacterized protein n=1 Tax=Camellia sinensis TaxID=4442 RepID=A0A7J7GHR3_CAMSI|nr:hypothetical protein HYC85_023195 [Camellia sinensis]
MSELKVEKPLAPSSSSRKLPDFKQSIKLKYVKLGYHYLITHGMYLFLTPLIVVIAAHLSTFSPHDLYLLWDHLRFNLISVILVLNSSGVSVYPLLPYSSSSSLSREFLML